MNDLNERISEAIEGEEAYPHLAGYGAHAQAIIDDLGLTAEWMPGSEVVYENGNWQQVSTHHRVVGRWERA